MVVEEAKSAPLPVSSELGTYKTVDARFLPWLEPFSVKKSLIFFEVFPLRSAAGGWSGLRPAGPG
jgi:hypothetical protein